MAKDHLLKVLNGEALTGKIIKQIQEHLFPGEKNGKKSSFLETTTAADETHQFIPAPLAVTTVDPIVVEPATNKGFLARRLSSSSSEQGSSAENGLESSVHLAVEEIRSAVGEEQKPPHLKTSRSKHQTRKFLSRRRADDVDDLQTDDLDAATTGQVRTLAQSESGDLQAWAGSLLEDGSGAPGGVGKTWDQELAERTVTGDNIKVQEAVENPEALKGLEEKLFGEKVEVDKVKDKEQNPSAGAVAVQSSSALGRFFESMTKNVQSVLDTKFPSASQTAQGDDQDKTAISKIDKNTTPEQARNWLETVVEKVPFMKSIFHFVTHSFHVSICSMVAGAVTKLLVSTFLRFYTPRTTALGLPAALRILIYTFLTSDESGLRHYIDLAILKSWGLGLVQAVARSVLGKLIANMGHVARWGGSAFHKLFSTAVKKLWVSKSAQAGGSPGAGAAASGGG
ncbi:unnamed protein product [Amoebophrya sp. A120]|nr:unnamed protein product [Amoebophrya sp. A120]|eukprot:GSA120T00014007001.1